MKEVLAKEWARAGIQKGDTVLLHSNIKRTFKRYLKNGIRLTKEDILTSFLTALGPSGTLLLPLFNFDFTKGIAFDIRHSQSAMGALTEAGRTHPNAIRTGHPIYSFVAIGHKAEKFKGINNFSGYGPDSPFALLKELNGKIAVLDLPEQNSMTFYHHVEEMHQVDYRYHKTFQAQYTDEYDNTTTQTYGLFVRDLVAGVTTKVEPAGELMWEKKLYSGDRENQASGLRIISAKNMYNMVSEIITSGKSEGLLYEIKGIKHD